MVSSFTRGAVALTALTAALTWGSRSRADDTVVVQPQAQPQPAPQSSPVVVANAAPPARERESVEGAGPNRYLLTSGLIVFGVPYLTSVAVAASSPHDGDDRLYVPLLGPWLDLGSRPGCPVSEKNCDPETGNKVLLGADGVLQALGALQIVGAFLMPETRSVTTVPATAYTPAMTLTPQKMGKDGYGIGAFAQF